MAKILFYSTAAPEGGHFRSMCTIGAAMQRRGHKVWVLTGSGPGIHIAQKLELETINLPSKCHLSIEFNWADYFFLRDIIKKLSPDVVNSFANGIPALILACRNIRTSVTATLCGGPPRRIIPYVTPIIVFSKELKKNMVDLGIPEEEVHVIPGRIQLKIPTIDTEVHEFLGRLCIDAKMRPLIFMICRADVPKKRALYNFFAAAELYCKNGGNGTFIHIGKGKDNAFVKDLHSMVEKINVSVGRNVLISTEEGSDAPVKYLNLADIVIGMGRSAFEGMILSKSTIVLSNEGCGGIVNEQNTPILALHNFTSRGEPQSVDLEVQNKLVKNISLLSQSTDENKSAAEFGYKWCVNNLDVDKAAEQYEAIFCSMMSKPKQPIRLANIGINILYETLRTVMYRPLQMFYSFFV